jgi:hypothetical protein
MEKIRGLYKITNAYSGLFYIGKSVDIYKRWITHKKDFENGTHAGGAFQYDYDVFGKEAFKFEILYEDAYITDIDLLIKEAQTIELLNPQYNDIGGTFTYNKKCNFYSWLRSICDDIWMLIKNSFDRNFINMYPLKLFTFISEEEIEFVTRYSNVFTPFFSMFTPNDVWIRYDKKRMIVSILDKSVIPDIVTPDDIIYHTESLL